MNERGAARAVRAGVDNDQGTAHAVASKSLQGQGLLKLKANEPNFIDAERHGGGGCQRVDVQAMVDGCYAPLHPAVAMAQQVFAANRGGLGVQPSQRGAEGFCGLQALWRGDPVATGYVQLAIQHDASRLPRMRRADNGASPMHLCHHSHFFTGKDLHRVAHPHCALRNAAPQRARLVAFAVAFGRARNVLHGQHQCAGRVVGRTGQTFQQLQ